MENFYTRATDDTPEFKFNYELGVLKISGNSFPDDPFVTYEPAFRWVDEYTKNPAQFTIIQLNLNYINTASSKQLNDFLFQFQEKCNPKTVKVEWYFDPLDDDMEFEGEALKGNFDIEFELIPKN